MITCLVVDRDRRWNGYGYIFISFRVEPVARSTVRRWILYEERVRIFVSSTRLIRPRVVTDHLSSDSFFFFHYALSPIRIVGGRESQRGRNIRGNPKLFPRACTSDTTRGWLAGVSATTTWISCRNYTRQAKDFRVQSPGVPYVVPSSCSIIIISFSFEFEFLNSPPSPRFPS